MGKKKSQLQELTEIWMAMERRTLDQRREAEDYYYANLMKPIAEDYVKRNKKKILEKVDYLILSVGTSYEPIVLNISLLNPSKILFLYTEQTEVILNKIVSFLDLSADRYLKRQVDSTDSLSIYHEIKNAYIRWNRPMRVYIDFTGGTKTMSAAAALAGSIIDVQLIYVGTEEYMPDFRKPAPGSENLYYIDNPVQVFGDLELEKISALMEKCNYAGAAGKLEELMEQIPDPVGRQQIRFVYLLVKTYEHWDALEFSEAYAMMEQLLKELKRDYRLSKTLALMEHQTVLTTQHQILQKLDFIPDLIAERKQTEILSNTEMIISLMFTMYTNAHRREEQEKYDMATLLLYRLLEMVMQERLMRYNIYISRPDYTNVDFSNADKKYEKQTYEEQLKLLKKSNLELKKTLFPKTDRDFLPAPIALLDGYTLLAALGDAVICDGLNCINQLKRIRAMVSLRNNSIFAHGLGPVGNADYCKFRDFVVTIFRKFCSVESVDIELYEKGCTFINPFLDNKLTTEE